LGKFADELFKITSREGREYAMKPMNCPHHTQIFDRKPHSYREMPQRYAETTMVYRDEQSASSAAHARALSPKTTRTSFAAARLKKSF
jgi:threonyl-tRNA synthetase